jgi:Zn-dependent protease
MQLFTKEELKDILIAVLTVTLIFSYDVDNPANTVNLFPLYILSTVIVFLFHELAHRFVARKFGCLATFKLWPQGILFGLLFMLIGIKFVAVGAIQVLPFAFGRWGYRIVELTAKEMGLIAASGVGVNIFFAIIFKPLAGTLMWQGIDVFGSLAFINSWLALINLLPVPPLDGSKIMAWKPMIWFILFLAAVLLVFL